MEGTFNLLCLIITFNYSNYLNGGNSVFGFAKQTGFAKLYVYC